MKDKVSVKQRILDSAKALNAEERDDWEKIWIDDIKNMLWVLS